MSKLNSRIEQLLVDLKQVRTDNRVAVKNFRNALRKANAISSKLEQAEDELAKAATDLAAIQKKASLLVDRVTKTTVPVKASVKKPTPPKKTVPVTTKKKTPVKVQAKEKAVPKTPVKAETPAT